MILLVLVWVVSLSSCKIEPEPIQYGADQCHFCKMNIVDKAHAAQYVTDKGKQYKYDAIECMIREISRAGNLQISMKLVSDFSAPGNMIPAEEASYIISPGIKSPMGANLSAVKELDQAKKLIQEFEGAVFNWDDIQGKINSK